MENCTHIEIFLGDLVACGKNKKGDRIKIPLLEIRASMVPPEKGNPGYAIFFGLGKERNVAGKNPLIFLHECQEKLQGPLLEKATDAATRLRCATFYVNRAGQRGAEGFYGAVWRYFNDAGLNINLVPASSPQDSAYGVSLIQEALATEALKLPERETILKNNLKQITIENLNDESPSFNACRFLLAGFEKFPHLGRPAFTQGGIQAGRRNIDRKDARGWT